MSAYAKCAYAVTGPRAHAPAILLIPVLATLGAHVRISEERIRTEEARIVPASALAK